MSRNALGRALGEHSSTVSDWFTKQAMPLGSVLLLFPGTLKCSGHWLLTGQGPEEPHSDESADYRAGARAALADIEDAIETVRASKARR